MTRILAIATSLLWLPVLAAAETAVVRSGEHDGFTRLVVYLPETADWTLREEPDRVTLLTGPTVTFDTSAVYTRFGRERAKAVAPGEDGAHDVVVGRRLVFSARERRAQLRDEVLDLGVRRARRDGRDHGRPRRRQRRNRAGEDLHFIILLRGRPPAAVRRDLCPELGSRLFSGRSASLRGGRLRRLARGRGRFRFRRGRRRVGLELGALAHARRRKRGALRLTRRWRVLLARGRRVVARVVGRRAR